MHLALYRKWRSVSFDDVSGQTHVTSVLKYEAANGMISHAYLFSGPRGTGKTSCAKILSRAVNCLSPVNGNPCNECAACRSILSGSAVDVIEMDAASNNGVDHIRDIRDGVVFTPAELKYRVYIVDEVHMLSVSAFNALLKTLEEPPAHVIFILATTELHKLPETVISRCQRFDFRRLSVPVISERLAYISEREGFKTTKGALDEIARLSEGGMRDAISLLELCAGRHTTIDEALVSDVLGTLGYDKVASTAVAIAKADYDSIFSIIADLSAAGRDVSVFWDELIAFYRDMLIMKTTKEPSRFLDISENAQKALREAAQQFTVADLLYQSRLLDETAAAFLKTTGSKRTLAELALIRMCDASLDIGNDALLKRIASLEDTVKLLSVGGVVRTEAPSAAEAPAANRSAKKEPADTKASEKTSPLVNKASEEAAPVIAEDTPLPYWGELLSRAADKAPLIDGFRQFISGYKTSEGFTVLCANPFTHNMCTKNKKLFADLLTVFENSLVTEKDLTIKESSAPVTKSQVSLDDL